MERLIRSLAAIVVCCLLLPSACHKVSSNSEADDASQDTEPAKTRDPAPPEPPPTRITIDVEPDERDRWLFVEGVKKGTVGGWATGSFDPERNKLDIQTHDVRAFAVDVGRIAINWERLVILSIDGRTSELRRRDYTYLHFALDEYGQWVVVEP